MRRSYIGFMFLVCFYSLLVAAVPPAISVSNHLIPMPAVNFAKDSSSTANARLSPKEYERKISFLRKIYEHEYKNLARTLDNDEMALLSESREKRERFFFSLQKTLSFQLNTPVKVFYGIKGRERVTNVYRDASVAVMEQGISDLRRWSKGNFAPLKIKENSSAERKLANEEYLFNERASRNIYLMYERYRREEYASQAAWREFRDAQLLFIGKMTKSSHDLTEERILMLRRINNIRTLQAEGLVFFKQEREE